jgi:hypothetical protein
MSTTKQPPYRSVYLVFIDHSVLGAWPSKKAAYAARRLLLSHAMQQTSKVCGPYVLKVAR